MHEFHLPKGSLPDLSTQCTPEIQEFLRNTRVVHQPKILPKFVVAEECEGVGVEHVGGVRGVLLLGVWGVVRPRTITKSTTILRRAGWATPSSNGSTWKEYWVKGGGYSTDQDVVAGAGRTTTCSTS
jgi:hypothetical protein